MHGWRCALVQVAGELATVQKAAASESYARVNFHPACEAAINEQINIEYNVSYVYHALYCYFSRDNVALPGLAAYFKVRRRRRRLCVLCSAPCCAWTAAWHACLLLMRAHMRACLCVQAGSDEEREHAEVLMDYQNRRGGRVALRSMMSPEAEFDHPEKGDALYAMELALSLEKLNFTKLRELHDVADEHGDAQMGDFVEGALLAEQVEAVKKVAEYVSQLRRVGKGLGVYQFDKELLEEVNKAAGQA